MLGNHPVRALTLATVSVFSLGCGRAGSTDARGPAPATGMTAEAGDAPATSPLDATSATDAASDGSANPLHVTPSDPITAPDGQWTDIAFPDGYCRDGTQAHLMVHLNSKSEKFAIYLEGGGACFNDASCKLLDIDLPSYVLGQGIFNFSNSQNPIGDWNIFYVPYCTGDVHAGDNPMGDPGPLTGEQRFTGFTNLELYLARILATMPDATDELLVGSSAGGFGVGLTAGLVASNLPGSVERFTMLDDSGQPMSSQYIQPCLQDLWRQVWGFDNTFLKQCGTSCPTPDDYVDDWIRFLLASYANGPAGSKFMGGLLSWTSDEVISSFYGFGADDCTTTVPVPIPGATFEAGLLDFRTLVTSETSSFGTYYAEGSEHTFLLQDSSGLIQGVGLLGGLYDTQVGGVSLVDWIDDLLAHKPATQVGP